MKQIIKLTETDLHNIIKETIDSMYQQGNVADVNNQQQIPINPIINTLKGLVTLEFAVKNMCDGSDYEHVTFYKTLLSDIVKIKEYLKTTGIIK